MEARELGQKPVNGAGTFDGITLREHFAVAILAGLHANPAYADYTTLEASAVKSADLLLAELAKTAR
jgi:hypothetical protein